MINRMHICADVRAAQQPRFVVAHLRCARAAAERRVDRAGRAARASRAHSRSARRRAGRRGDADGDGRDAAGQSDGRGEHRDGQSQLLRGDAEELRGAVDEPRSDRRSCRSTTTSRSSWAWFATTCRSIRSSRATCSIRRERRVAGACRQRAMRTSRRSSRACANPASTRASSSQTTQTAVYGTPAAATAGAITTRAAAEAFFIAGTNRAMFRFTLMNHMCMDMEQVHDTSIAPDRIRQDVSRSPGGDSRVFLNNCIGCHAGMDPLAQAFAYYNFDETSGSDGLQHDARCTRSTSTTTRRSRTAS